MSYHLLSGATGLLGRYLVRDLILADVPIAVLVRSSRRLSAQDRMEAIMRYWEQQLEQKLPRPKVLESDLCEPFLGLSDEDQQWVADNCESMIHSAASLSFVATGPESEPWRSNVGGVKNVIALCEQAGIRKMHHVSTAYVCGLRTGTILESELDVGQALSNPYEESKMQAEKLMRGSSQFDMLTVHRPAIIIGDSQTGFTNTFHGFYAALQLTFTLVKMYQPDETGKSSGTEATRLTLDGHETKNLIPVDWVSAAMSHIITHPELHGETYHLTPHYPVTARLIRDVLESACHFYGARLTEPNIELENPSEIERLFYEHIRVYNSYWRNDPAFDSSNTQAAVPHLPCPHIDRQMLLRLSQAAIKQNFGWNDRALLNGNGSK